MGWGEGWGCGSHSQSTPLQCSCWPWWPRCWSWRMGSCGSLPWAGWLGNASAATSTAMRTRRTASGESPPDKSGGREGGSAQKEGRVRAPAPSERKQPKVTFETSDTQPHDQRGDICGDLRPVGDPAPEIRKRRSQLRVRSDPTCFPLAQSCFLAWKPNHPFRSTLLMARDVTLGCPA